MYGGQWGRSCRLINQPLHETSLCMPSKYKREIWNYYALILHTALDDGIRTGTCSQQHQKQITEAADRQSAFSLQTSSLGHGTMISDTTDPVGPDAESRWIQLVHCSRKTKIGEKDCIAIDFHRNVKLSQLGTTVAYCVIQLVHNGSTCLIAVDAHRPV